MSHSINIIKNKFEHTVFLKKKVHIFQKIIFRNDQYLNGITKTLQKLNPLKGIVLRNIVSKYEANP